MTKETYVNAAKKKLIRDWIFSKIPVNKIVGLAGPDINQYIEWCVGKNYTDINIFEKDAAVLLKQLSDIHYSNVNIVNDDIDTTEIYPNTVYDLDYCCTIKSVKNLDKFKDRFVATFSLRGVSADETVDEFIKQRKEKFVDIMSFTKPFKHDIFATNKSGYIFTIYRDTSPMCCIAKIN